MDDWTKIWKEHMENLTNVENECGDSTDAEEGQCAMNRMKIGKAGAPSGSCYRIVSEWWG